MFQLSEPEPAETDSRWIIINWFFNTHFPYEQIEYMRNCISTRSNMRAGSNERLPFVRYVPIGLILQWKHFGFLYRKKVTEIIEISSISSRQLCWTYVYVWVNHGARMHVLIHEINVNLHVRRESYKNYILRNYWYFLFTHFRGDIHSPIGAGNTNKFKHCHFHPSAIFCGRWMFAHSYGFLLLLVVWCEKCNRSAARSVLILIGFGSRGLSTEWSLCCKCENVGCSTYQ